MNYLGREYKSFAALAREYNINCSTLKSRVARGYTLEEAINYDTNYFKNKSYENLTFNREKLSKEKVVAKFSNYGYKILNYNYKNNQTRMLCQNKDGYLVYMSYGALGVSNPYVFSINYNKENFIYNANIYGGINKYKCKVIDFRSGYLNKPDILCVCNCGNNYWYNFNEWKSKHIDLCPKCRKKISRYENLVCNYLYDLNINFKYQYRFNDCRYKKPLPFDFYLPNYNACIEVDGEQHFNGSRFDKITVGKWAKFNSDKRNKLDNLKTSYCKKNNIRLLRIPYYDFKKDKYKEQINSFLALY